MSFSSFPKPPARRSGDKRRDGEPSRPRSGNGESAPRRHSEKGDDHYEKRRSGHDEHERKAPRSGRADPDHEKRRSGRADPEFEKRRSGREGGHDRRDRPSGPRPGDSRREERRHGTGHARRDGAGEDFRRGRGEFQDKGHDRGRDGGRDHAGRPRQDGRPSPPREAFRKPRRDDFEDAPRKPRRERDSEAPRHSGEPSRPHRDGDTRRHGTGAFPGEEGFQPSALYPREDGAPLPDAPRADADRAPEREEPRLLPGLKPVLELLERAPGRVDMVFVRKGRHGEEAARLLDLCRESGVRFSLLDPPAFARVYAGKSQGVVARLFEAGFVEAEEIFDKAMDAPLPLVLVLDQVQDPGNAGTLARTLYALGGAGMIIPRHNGVYLGASASKAAAGALELLPVAKVASLGHVLDQADKLGFAIYGAASGTDEAEYAGPSGGTGGADEPEHAPHGAKNREAPAADLFSLVPRLPAVLVLGGEESGIRQSLEKRCHTLIRIPLLRAFDSLNVAQAGGIITAWFANSADKKRG